MNPVKSLKAIQTLSKIGKIISKIIYICCIVGFVGCIVGAIAMLVGGEAVKLGGMTLHSILETEANLATGTVWTAIGAGAILCLGEIILTRMAFRYFEHELNAGTPFTADGAKELLRLGISVLWIPIVTVVLAQIVQNIIALFLENTEMLNLDGFTHVELGLALILVSLLCRCGTELLQAESQTGETH